MTVKEAIEKLKTLRPDAEVMELKVSLMDATGRSAKDSKPANPV